MAGSFIGGGKSEYPGKTTDKLWSQNFVSECRQEDSNNKNSSVWWWWNKNVDITFVHMTLLWNNPHLVRCLWNNPHLVRCLWNNPHLVRSKWLSYLWNLRILRHNKSTCQWLIIHGLYFEVNSYHMSVSCIYSDYWLVNWSSQVIIQYQGANLNLKYLKWTLHM